MSKIQAFLLLLCAGCLALAAFSKSWFIHNDQIAMVQGTSVFVGMQSARLCDPDCETIEHKELPYQWAHFVTERMVMKELGQSAPVIPGLSQMQSDEDRVVASYEAAMAMRQKVEDRALSSLSILKVCFYFVLGLIVLLAALALLELLGKNSTKLLWGVLVLAFVSIGTIMVAMTRAPESMMLGYSFWVFTLGACGSIPVAIITAKTSQAAKNDWWE